jgi:hypothetical protein
MSPGQHAVHDDDVVGLAGREKHAVAAVGGVIGGMPGLLQAFDDELADPLVVFDQQDFHGASPAGGGGAACAVFASSTGCDLRRRLSHRLKLSRYR